MKHPSAFIGEYLEAVYIEETPAELPFVALVFADGYIARSVADASIGRIAIGRDTRGVVEEATVTTRPIGHNSKNTITTVKMRVSSRWLTWSYVDSQDRDGDCAFAVFWTSLEDADWPNTKWRDVTSGYFRPAKYDGQIRPIDIASISGQSVPA